jgi:site-specific DNA recombinase
MLNVQGVPSKTGKQWSATTVANILRNPFYSGMVQASDKVVPGRHEAIISPEQFQMVQDIISSRADLAPRSHCSPNLLAGIARCARCNRTLRSHLVTQKRVHGPSKTYLFYQHPTVVKVGDKDCRKFDKSAPILEGAVVAKIREVAESGVLQRLALQEVRGRLNTGHAPLQAKRDKVSLELAQLADKFTQWADRLDAGKIDEEQFEQQNQRLLQKKKDLQKQLVELDEKLVEGETLEVNLAEVKQVLQDFPKVWDVLEHEEKQEMLRLLVEHLKVSKERAELKLLFLDPVEINLSFTPPQKEAL